MLRDRDADDVWLGLARQVADTGDLAGSADASARLALLTAGAEAVAWDLVFPEVFPAAFPSCWAIRRGMWCCPTPRILLPLSIRAVLDAANADRRGRRSNRRCWRVRALPARSRLSRRVRAGETYRRPVVQAPARANRCEFDRREPRSVPVVCRTCHGAGGGDGSIGVLMPSAFHANEGTTGVRRLYLREAGVSWCLSFENRRRIFDIDSRFKFDLIVAHRPGPTLSLRCGFYLERIEDAGDPDENDDYMAWRSCSRTGGAGLTPLELRGAADLLVAQRLFAGEDRLEAWCARDHIRFGNDLHMTADCGVLREGGRRRVGAARGQDVSPVHRLLGPRSRAIALRWDRSRLRLRRLSRILPAGFPGYRAVER